MENQELQNDTKKKVITVYPKNTEWKEGKTKKGEKTLYRRYNNKPVNIGFFKNGHVWISYNNEFIKDHNLKYVNDEQIQKDVDNLLTSTLVIIQ